VRAPGRDSAAPTTAPARAAVDGTSAVVPSPDAGVVAVEVEVVVDVLVVSGWIDTNRLSQIIRFGAYHHFVKKRLNWVTVSFVLGRMS
jgi:hypothetical protein